MKLDPKVKENALIGHCFNAEELKRFIGKECYFTDNLEEFSDLTNTLNGVLKAVGDAEDCYLVESEINGQPADCHYTFCLPAEFVKEEKKYRHFTAYEFQRLFNIGDVICIRRKNAKVVENLLYAGFKSDAGNLPCILLGNEWHDFGELFADFEYIDDGDFKPFGVEE